MFTKFINKFLFLSVFLLILPLVSEAKKPDMPPGLNKEVHSAGTNVISPDGTVWLITETGERRPYISETAFTSYAFNSFEFVVSASKGDLTLPKGSLIAPRDGKIIVSNSGVDNGVLYVMSKGQKNAFTSTEVFTSLGYSFFNAIASNLTGVPFGPVIDSATQAHPAGSLINENGTVLYIGAGGKYGIPDLNTFISWGFNFSEVLPTTAGDIALPIVGILPVRQAGQLNPPIE